MVVNLMNDQISCTNMCFVLVYWFELYYAYTGFILTFFRNGAIVSVLSIFLARSSKVNVKNLNNEIFGITKIFWHML